MIFDENKSKKMRTLRKNKSTFIFLDRLYSLDHKQFKRVTSKICASLLGISEPHYYVKLRLWKNFKESDKDLYNKIIKW